MTEIDAGWIVNGSAAAPSPEVVAALAADWPIAARRGQRFRFADDLIREIDAAEALGVRVLLVHVSGPGGHLDGSLAIYTRLRAFASRGVVITYMLPGRCASTATVVALAGDVRVIHPRCDYLIHSSDGPTARAIRDGNARILDIFTDRTTVPRAELERGLAFTFTEAGVARALRIDPNVAVAVNVATCLGDATTARHLARAAEAEQTRRPYA